MSTDYLTSIVIILVSALILHLRSHVKFIALGAFIGLVLAQQVGQSVFGLVAGRLPNLNSEWLKSGVQLGLLLLPALILGFNHTLDKHKWSFIRTIVFVAITTLFLLTSIISVLPNDIRLEILNRSVIAAQLHYFRTTLSVMVAALIVIDSFHHKETLRKLRHG